MLSIDIDFDLKILELALSNNYIVRSKVENKKREVILSSAVDSKV